MNQRDTTGIVVQYLGGESTGRYKGAGAADAAMAPRGENRAAKSALRAPTMAAISHPLPFYLPRRSPPLPFSSSLKPSRRRSGGCPRPPSRSRKQKRCLRSGVRRVAVEWVAAVPSGFGVAIGLDNIALVSVWAGQ